MRKRNKILSAITLVGVFVGLTALSFFAAQYTLHSAALQGYIAAFGYIGAVGIATIAGLNVLIPLPVALLTPVFTAAGFSMPGLIISFTIGTLLADFIGYALGHTGRGVILQHYPNIVRTLEQLHDHHYKWLIPAVFIYASFVPFPNEALVIPLALLGVKWRVIIIPLFIGNLLNQTIYAYGAQNVYQWLFF